MSDEDNPYRRNINFNLTKFWQVNHPYPGDCDDQICVNRYAIYQCCVTYATCTRCPGNGWEHFPSGKCMYGPGYLELQRGGEDSEEKLLNALENVLSMPR